MKKLKILSNKFFSYLNIAVPPWKQILVYFLITRILLSVIGASSQILLAPFHGKEDVWHYSSHRVLSVWGVWDTGWYLNIAKHGYSPKISTYESTKDQANFAFFPLFPLTIRLLGEIVRNNFIAGIIISNICLLGSAILIYKLLCLDYDEEVGKRAIKYLFLFPTAFILSGVFSESLYLFLVLLCFYALRRSRWLILAIAGFLVSLTRSTGILIVLPLAYEYWRQITSGRYKWKLKNIVALATPILGILVFVYFNYFLTGDPLAFVHIQNAWGRFLQNPIAVLVHNIATRDVSILLAEYLTLASITLLAVMHNKIRPSYLLFSLYSIFIPLSTGLLSMPRFLVTIFPLFLACTLITKKPLWEEAFVIGLSLIQGCLMIFWSNGFPLLQ